MQLDLLRFISELQLVHCNDFNFLLSVTVPSKVESSEHYQVERDCSGIQ